MYLHSESSEQIVNLARLNNPSGLHPPMRLYLLMITDPSQTAPLAGSQEFKQMHVPFGIFHSQGPTLDACMSEGVFIVEDGTQGRTSEFPLNYILVSVL